MRSWIDYSGEVVREPSPSLIAQLVEAGQPFWLDIENPTGELLDQLATRLGLHPLAVEDSRQFGQRAKLQVYGNEQRVMREADDQELAEITAIRRRAAVTRRILTPGRDVAARTPLIQSLPGATSETQLYAEDINHELQQVVADSTAIEERCAALLVLHAALASKHLAGVSRRLADVATIFLPISFLAGFWGQNFNVLTGRIEKGWPGVPGPRRGTERGLRCGDRLHAQPLQPEVMRMSDELTDSRWGASRPASHKQGETHDK